MRMKTFLKSIRVTSNQFNHLITTKRIPVIFILVALFIIENIQPINAFSLAVDIPTTPFAFAHIVNDYRCQLIILAGGVFLFSDAPFEKGNYMYFISRTGKLSWVLGQLLYIVTLSLVYVLFVLIISIVPFIGNIDNASVWGKIWGTLAKTDAGSQFNVQLIVTEHLIKTYSPISATMLSLALEWACVAWLGFLTLLFNKLTKSAAGTMLSGFFVLLDICIANDWMPWANLFSPATLAQLNAYAGYNLAYNITLKYGVYFFIFGLFVLCILNITIECKPMKRIIRRFREDV
jgi:hypothetical protein